MTTINIKENQITIALPKTLTERQRYMINLMVKSIDIQSVHEFLRSFEGKRTYYVNKYSTPLKARGHDALAEKRAGSILSLYNEKRSLFNSKLSPSASIPAGKAVGIEIECYIPMSISELEYKFRDTKITNVRAADDGSIRAEEGYTSVEFRVLSNLDDLTNLKQLCEFLSYIGARVNRSCGLHVHLDARDYARCPDSIVSRLRNALPMLCAMVPESRINNEFCAADVSSDGQRYAKINKESFRRHKTIEIRLHSGTCDYEIISSWIKIVSSIAFSAKRLKAFNIMSYATALNWDAALVAYITERCRKFNPAYLGEPQAPSSTHRDEENREIPEEVDECLPQCGCGIYVDNDGDDCESCYEDANSDAA